MSAEFRGPETQFDNKVRIVSLNNLRAMCERVSGSYCHSFSVTKTTAHSVSVSYSNENEHAVARPFLMVFRAYQTKEAWGRTDTFVILDPARTVHETPDHGGEGWQCFQILLDCPTLWRDPTDERWKTREEIEKEQANQPCL